MECSILDKLPACESHATAISGFLNEFKQTLINIIYNSIDAITERYEKSEKAVRDGFITIDINVEGNDIYINIADNGTGIDQDVLDKVFNPFFTTKEQGKGTGIGLYMARTVIEKYMCGSIAAVNNGKGVTMKILLHKDANCF